MPDRFNDRIAIDRWKWLRRNDLRARVDDVIIQPIGDRQVDEEVDEGPALDSAFDGYIAGGHAPWLVRRTGDGIFADRTENSDVIAVPSAANTLPRLEGTDVPGLVDTRPHTGGWYRPEFGLLADDPVFAFEAVQTGEPAGDGSPFNRATLTVPFHAGVMPDAIRAIFSAATNDPAVVPALSVDSVSLAIPVTASDGTVKVETVTGTAVRTSEETPARFRATFNLTGDVVEAAYVHLTRHGGAELLVTAAHAAYQTIRATVPDVGFPTHGPVFHGWQFDVYGDGEHKAPAAIEMWGVYRYIPVTARFNRRTPIGLSFQTDALRNRFTITAGGATRPIVDADDLARFAGPRSEYRELTSLGNVQARYPSLRALYFGQVSGTVVAVPTAYGISCGSTGLAASCDSVVDPSPGSSTKCRFHFTFTLTPSADPVDLAGLARDITTIPEAAGRDLRLTLPPGLDPRFASTLDGFTAGAAGFADGATAHTVALSLDIADDETIPSTSLVNMFLVQLAARAPAPLFGNLAVRLDADFPNSVRTQLVLNVHQTAGTDELVIAYTAGGDSAALTNVGPFDLVLHRYCTASTTGITVTSLAEQPLPVGQSTEINVAAGGVDAVAVSRSLAVPAALPSAQLLRYIRFDTTVVSELQHPLNVNATAVDFAGAGIARIAIRFLLKQSPATPIPALTLLPAHTVDFVHVQTPVDTAVTGLDCSVQLTVDDNTGGYTKTIDHDFTTDPILVLTTIGIRP